MFSKLKQWYLQPAFQYEEEKRIARVLLAIILAIFIKSTSRKGWKLTSKETPLHSTSALAGSTHHLLLPTLT